MDENPRYNLRSAKRDDGVVGFGRGRGRGHGLLVPQKKDDVTPRALPKTFSDVKSTDLPKLYDGYREPEIVVDVPRAWIVQDEEALDGQWKTALRTGSQVEVSEKFFTIFKLASLERDERVMFNGAGKALFQELWKLCNSKLIGRQSTTTHETDWLHIAGVKLSGVPDFCVKNESDPRHPDLLIAKVKSDSRNGQPQLLSELYETSLLFGFFPVGILMWPFNVELYLYEEKKGRYSQYRTDIYSLSSVMALFRRAARAVELIDTNISLQHFHIEKRPKATKEREERVEVDQVELASQFPSELLLSLGEKLELLTERIKALESSVQSLQRWFRDTDSSVQSLQRWSRGTEQFLLQTKNIPTQPQRSKR